MKFAISLIVTSLVLSLTPLASATHCTDPVDDYAACQINHAKATANKLPGKVELYIDTFPQAVVDLVWCHYTTAPIEWDDCTI